jgi:hypothetical protein
MLNPFSKNRISKADSGPGRATAAKKAESREDAMKKSMALMVILLGGCLAGMLLAQDFTYVGSAKCQICHRTESQGQQFPIWQKSAHSQSFQALTTPDAQKLAADSPTNAKCLACHAPLAEKAPELQAEGVTCEVCHGPGSEYKKLRLMKNKEEAVKNGLVNYANAEAINAQCLKCHHNAHNKAFDFAASWDKIKHAVPQK